MRGFGHDTGNEVFTWSHDSSDQDWVAKIARVERVGPSRPGSRAFGGLGLKLEKEGTKRLLKWTASTVKQLGSAECRRIQLRRPGGRRSLGPEPASLGA